MEPSKSSWKVYIKEKSSLCISEFFYATINIILFIFYELYDDILCILSCKIMYTFKKNRQL